MSIRPHACFRRWRAFALCLSLLATPGCGGSDEEVPAPDPVVPDAGAGEVSPPPAPEPDAALPDVPEPAPDGDEEEDVVVPPVPPPPVLLPSVTGQSPGGVVSRSARYRHFGVTRPYDMVARSSRFQAVGRTEAMLQNWAVQEQEEVP